ncbi:polyribonucleotide nucleotidyltransferase [Marivirga lumbricoides]|uniref:Polyribonucleotide nucleotidyltransferase n=1 Tax=Marivirga lumbricoides TaxID=1046115 RepID=A0ABQ1LXZ3_9BACT|nr:polyribonucleotide nucleotidyltransferase [Marivirga lumbricoides]
MAIPQATIKKFNLPDGREVSIQTGKLAKQADGAVEVRMGNTMLLATVVSNKEAKEGVDFLPLSVDYQEKFASAGKIPGGFLKREGKLSDHEVLVSRLVDRALRPLFPDDYHADTQMFIQLFSADEDALPDSLAALAASAAIAVSDIPFAGPISEVRVGRIDGKMIINPTKDQMKISDIDMIIAATADNIMMVEGEMKEISEGEMVEAINFAHEAIKIQCQAQIELAQEFGLKEKREYSHEEEDDTVLEKEITDKYYDQFYKIASNGLADKHERAKLFKEVSDAYFDALPEEHEVNTGLAKKYFKAAQKKAIRNATLETRKRLDGRALDEIRPIWGEVDYLPSAHGSAVFTRGETQSLTTVTLGTKLDEQMIDGAMHAGFNKFILHYNFPGFSTGEAKPNRGPGRREVGHGNLAMRAIKQVLPTPEELPYTIRVVSDILESNGSSSMATVCAGILALMDAGIPIKAPVSGIAMGLISDPKTGKYAILSDILGDEDHIGDMDFKVTGTEKGITACQMDIKVDGLSSELMMEALNQAKAGRDHIRNEMLKVISAPREDYKPTAPRVVNIEIEREMIGAVIGPGGKVVQEIQKTTGATVVIEETEKGGKINVFAVNKESLDKAVSWIKGIVAKPEVGEVYDGKVKAIQPYGAFVEIMPGKDGLLHISEIKWEKVESLEGVLEIGEEIKVKLIDIDKKTGKLRLSRKVLLPKPEKAE